jgi:uncharacterized membrane protein
MAAPGGEGDELEAGARPAGHDAYGVGRLLAFSDGVFAIAITLLVLSVPVPDVPAGPDLNARLGDALLRLAPNLGAFAFSFLLVGAQWMIHHRLLRGVRRSDRGLMWLNLLTLLGICLVPLATTLLVRYGDQPNGCIAYASLQVGISLSYMALRLYLANLAGRGRGASLLGLVQVAGFAASIPVAGLNVNAAYALWLGGFALARFMEGWTRRSAH